MRLVEQLQLQRGVGVGHDDITFNGLHPDELGVKKQRLHCVPVASIGTMVEEKSPLPLTGPRALVRVPRTPRIAKQYLAKVAKNDTNTAMAEECNSDSSEELQYGPGIVKKLKSKYLSMTLRESGSRPSLSNMRRATSLENLLDEEPVKQTDTKPPHFVKRVPGHTARKVVSTHQSRSAEPSQRDMKRARSMETLLRYDPKLHMSHSNSGLNVHLEDVENDSTISDNREWSAVHHRKSAEGDKEESLLLRKKLAVTVEQTELPPPDLVKQTLKIFESSGSPGPVSPPVPPVRSSVSKSVNFKTNNAKPVPKVNNSVSKKPQVSPKPVFSPEKLRSPAKVASPKKSVEVSDRVTVVDSVSAPPPVPCRRSGDSSPVPVSPVSPLSSPVAPLASAVPPSQARNSSIRSPPSPRKTMGLPVLSPTEDKPPPIPRRDKSPSSSTPATPLTPTTPVNGNSNGRPESLDVKPIYSASDSDEEMDDIDAVSTKSVSTSALENIRKDGTSMQFSFGANMSPSNDMSKSHLPKVKPTPPKDLPIPVKSMPTNNVRSMSPFENPADSASRPGTVFNVAALPHGAVLKSPESPVQHAKQVGVIRPLVSTKHHTPHNSSPVPSAATTLTNREIEKNLINRAKSIEQPVTKVVVSLKKLPDDVVVGSVSHGALAFAVNGEEGSSPPGASAKRGKAPGLWDKKPWHHQDNTMVFNFSNRKEVPDYIENDGLILRGKREKPRDGGVLLLGASADESSTDGDPDGMGDVDEWLVEPPSPCSVVFEGSNVIINGRSNLRKQSPRQPRKLRIQFNDEATTMFEYPSEASLLEDGAHPAPTPPPPSTPAPAPPSAPSPGLSGLPVPLGSGSLASYTPSKLQLGALGASEPFQLGVTRVPSASSPSLSSLSSPDDAASGASTASSVDTLEADRDHSDDGDHLKPAREGESVTWSEESGTDLLF
ncbi:flocculation protein FLO11 isoform X2 [Thrips palmi]|uniref:Flocculation protein FLO11 isoform X2 n=1 Tax=Thrips palmi TaxID=161013 RepID=A0A6P8ZW75_THRPL|nr:flocculation protein FLO11 isoform X2 [Thrips palmi]